MRVSDEGERSAGALKEASKQSLRQASAQLLPLHRAKEWLFHFCAYHRSI